MINCVMQNWQQYEIHIDKNWDSFFRTFPKNSTLENEKAEFSYH